MGSGFSQLFPCFNPAANPEGLDQPEVFFTACEPLDETLGHSFCYVRSSARFLSPTASDRFVSPTHSLRLSPSHEPASKCRPGALPETGFKAISGASVSANTSTPRTVLQLENIYDHATNCDGVGGGVKASIVNGFESTSSFSALSLQPVPRGGGGGEPSGQMERAFFMSGPIERGAPSGPLEGAGGSDGGRVPFSAPLGGVYVKKKRKKGIPGIRNPFSRNFSEKKRPWVVPVRNFIGRKEVTSAGEGGDLEAKRENNVQWALGKAGEDRVHVVVSEEHGWLFVGIYDGFNGPDAPEFLMGNLYKAVYNELEGLFWDSEDACSQGGVNVTSEDAVIAVGTNQLIEDTGGLVGNAGEIQISGNESNSSQSDRGSVKKVTFQSEQTESRRRRLWEFLAEDHPEDGLDLSGSERFAFSVDDALSVSNAGCAVSRRSLLLSKLKHGLIKHKESKNLFPWRFGLEAKEKTESKNRVGERTSRSSRSRKVGPVDHESVLGALSRALELTELAYLDMTDKVLDQNPELALMGSCLLVVLMRDEDVYVMNVGDSRAIVAQYDPEEIKISTSSGSNCLMDSGLISEHIVDIVEESTDARESSDNPANENPTQAMRLTALQLSTDHSTSMEEEIIRVKNEHPDDSRCIVNDRVKAQVERCITGNV